MTDTPRTRWHQLSERPSGEDYAARFARLARSGQDVHGEATLVAGLVEPGARVLDAGCGTGRVGGRLAELGFEVVGVDVDESMLEVARREHPGVPWVDGDLAALPAQVTDRAPYDVVVLAGNVVPLLEAGTLPAAVAGVTGVLAPYGRLVAGFGLDPAHLPRGCPVTSLADYETTVAGAGLVVLERFSTWQAEPFDAAGGYVVSVTGLRS